MGRLIGLELHNFKSYRGTTTIGFGTSYFTSIIGPNGAGKSNMMDAISFVLGVSSTHLRSHNMKDLIYRGRRRDDSTDEPDPTRAYVMATYEKDGGEILQLKRTITSAGASEYRINDQSVTAYNYSLVLKAENILIKARNFLVFQGDVEQIASQSPKDLTTIIETISGSAEYSQEYEKLKDELEKAHEASNAVFSRKRTLNSESKQYKDQLAEQKEYEQKLYDKVETIKKLNLYRLFHNEKKHFECIDELEVQKEELNKLEADLAVEQAELKKAIAEHAKLVLSQKKHLSGKDELATKIESSKRDLIPVEAKRRAITSKISLLKNKVNDIMIDYSRQKKNTQKIEKELNNARSLYKEFQEKVLTTVSSSVTPEGQKEYEDLRSQYLANNGSQLEEELALVNNNKESLQVNILNLKTQLGNANSRALELMSIVDSDLNSKLTDKTNEINDILTLKQEKIDARAALIKSKEEFNYKELQLNTKLREVLMRLDELSSQQRESKKQRQLRENVAMLKKFFPKGAIKGLVYDLVRPTQQKYETALLTALGRNFDSIIVETTQTAYKCIEILKERRCGIATFIPLDSVVNDPINLNFLRSIDNAVQPGYDILEFDDKSLEQAIHYVVGNALIVDRIEKARELKWNSNFKLDCKLITLDGSVIHKSGLMTGGQQTQTYRTVLNWDRNEWNSLNESKEEITNDLLKLQEHKPKELEIGVMSEEIGALDDKLPVLRNQKVSIERVIADRKKEVEHQNELAVKFEASIKEKEKELADLDDEINTIMKSVRKLQESIYLDFCNKYGFTNGIEDYEDLHGATMRIRAKERTQFSKAISVLSNKLAFENERVKETEGRRESLELELKALEAELDVVLVEKQKLEDGIDRNEAELEVMSLEKDQLTENVEGQLRVAKSTESKVVEIEGQISSMTSEITSIEENMLKVDTERVNILKNCKIGNVNIPLADGLLSTIPIGENSDDFIRDAYNIEIDYSSLDTRFKDTYQIQIEAELENEIDNIVSLLEKLTPNAKAVERLRAVESKLHEFDRDHTLARQKEKKIANKFNSIKHARYEKFMEAFEHISGKIDYIYKELTKSNASPLGGSAYLTLEDEDIPFTSGIKYHAMPPMKRFRDMELLSGGEKTVAALALLFAIHSFHPSPFFVLDEVDAALDNANVMRIASYIKNHAGPSFQFIVISLKNTLFEKSDALVGIYREQRGNTSKTVTLDLREYPQEETPLAA